MTAFWDHDSPLYLTLFIFSSSFGIHENLPILEELYNDGKLNFVANAGLMAKPVDVSNYRTETPTQLFAHNAMQLETRRDDLFRLYSGTGAFAFLLRYSVRVGLLILTHPISACYCQVSEGGWLMFSLLQVSLLVSSQLMVKQRFYLV